MKFAASLLAVIGSAAAFAPASQQSSRASTTLSFSVSTRPTIYWCLC